MISVAKSPMPHDDRPPARSTARPRLLYLGNALPPGVSTLFPEAQPAGHLVETSLITSINQAFEIRSVGCSSLDLEHLPEERRDSLGLPNALNLTDRTPELYHRHRSLWRLRRTYLKWQAEGWVPDIILVCNFSPIYDGFIRWLKSRPNAPLLVLYLADSTTLGTEVPPLKRFRYHFKPLVFPEAEMLRYIDACVAVSPDTRKMFEERGLPWLWLPNGCEPRRALRAEDVTIEGPLRFGYVGALGGHAGLPRLLSIFTSVERNSVLHICGFGKARTEITAICRSHPRLRFHTPRTPDECLQLSRTWDVLVNPRPILPCNQNNFPSKLFEYTLTGRAILTSNVSGADVVLGPEAYYFDAHDFEQSLGRTLDELIATPRVELNRRGAAIQKRMLAQYSWAQQGERLAAFLTHLLAG